MNFLIKIFHIWCTYFTVSYHGRVARWPYFWKSIAYTVVGLSSVIFIVFVFPLAFGKGIGIVLPIFLSFLMLLSAMIAVACLFRALIALPIQRLHDINLSGWYLLVMYAFSIIVSYIDSLVYGVDNETITWITVLASALDIALLVWAGTKGANRFGDSPQDLKNLAERAKKEPLKTFPPEETIVKTVAKPKLKPSTKKKTAIKKKTVVKKKTPKKAVAIKTSSKKAVSKTVKKKPSIKKTVAKKAVKKTTKKITKK